MKFWYIPLFLFIMILTACGNNVDPMEHTDVEFSGIDTRGNANYFFNEESALENLYDVTHQNELSGEDYEEWETARSALDISLSNERELSNGDVVTLTVNVDEEATSVFSGSSEQEFEVSDLPEGTTITSEDLQENVTASFEGMDGEGRIDEISQSSDNNLPELQIEAENDGELSNGEPAQLRVHDDSFNDLQYTEYILAEEDRTFELEVSGLQEPEFITSQELVDNIIITFSGASGKGNVENIESTFSGDIPNINIEVENEGELENGGNAVVNITDDTIERLNSEGYAIEEQDRQFEIEVDGLTGYASDLSGIENLDAVKQLLQEEVDSRYEDISPDNSFFGVIYEVEFHQNMYRQYEDTSQSGSYQHNNLVQGNGNLFAIYSVDEYSGGEDSELEKESIVAIGFNNMELDEDQEVNLANLSDERVIFDNSYSLDAVIQLMEGYGYTTEGESEEE